MSVINRMLADLERRGSPGAGNAPAPGTDAPGRTPRRLRPWLERGVPLLLLIALIAVAGALWRERAPDVLAVMQQARSEAVPASPGIAGERGTEAPAPPTVGRVAFARSGEAVELTVEFSEALRERPGYRRDGERLVLRLPAAWNGRDLPDPPPDARIFRTLALSDQGEAATRLALKVAPDARFDLTHEGNRLHLTGRVPTKTARATSTSAQPAPPAVADADAEAASRDDGARSQDATTDSAPSEATGGAGSVDGATQGQPASDGRGGGTAVAEAEAPPADAGGADDTAGAESGAGTGDASGASTDAGGGDGEVRKSEPTLSPAERARQRESEARTALRNGDTARARERLQAALAADPARHSARELLVRLELRAGRTGQARNLLANGLQRAPRRAGFAKPYARLLVDAGELERALKVLERARPAGERDAGYHGLKAAIAQRLERHELAARAYTRALAIDRERGVWWLGLGISLAATDQPGRAREALRRARATGDLDQRLDAWAARRIQALAQE